MKLDTPLSHIDKQKLYETSVNVCFNQMIATKGIKTFGKEAVAAMFAEYKQLNDKNVFGRFDKRNLTKDLKRNALRAVNLIKRKRCGKLKGRTCAKGAPQRTYVPKEQASSPTLRVESLMALILINAFEKRDVAIFDVPGAYLFANLDDKFALLKIEGDFVKIMCNVSPDFVEDIVYENEKPVLYVQILKALYGMVESALLLYSLYIEVLLKNGFRLNPVDKCVANKIIDGK